MVPEESNRTVTALPLRRCDVTHLAGGRLRSARDVTCAGAAGGVCV